MKKYAFMLLGDYTPEKHTAVFEQGDTITRICTVSSFEMAKERIAALQQEGFGAVELCGAFTREMAKELMELTNRKVAIGYMAHESVLDPVFAKFFS